MMTWTAPKAARKNENKEFGKDSFKIHKLTEMTHVSNHPQRSLKAEKL